MSVDFASLARRANAANAAGTPVDMTQAEFDAVLDAVAVRDDEGNITVPIFQPPRLFGVPIRIVSGTPAVSDPVEASPPGP